MKELQAHVCNCCEKKGTVITYVTIDNKMFNLCIDCTRSILADFIQTLTISQIESKFAEIKERQSTDE